MFDYESEALNLGPQRIRVAVFLKVSNDLHDLLLPSQTLLSGLMRLPSLSSRLFSGFGASIAGAPICRRVVKPYDPFGQHDFVHSWLMLLLLLDEDQFFIQGKAHYFPAASPKGLGTYRLRVIASAVAPTV